MRVLRHQRFMLPEGVPLPLGYDIACCAACGAVYADTPASQADHDAYYAAHSRYEDPAVATGGGDAAGDFQRIERTADRLMALMPGVAVRVLDAGCAGGGLLRALRARGLSALTGMDPSVACVARVRADGFDVHAGRLPAAADALPAAGFDLIVLSHVLEHLVDVADTLRALRRLLSPAGMLYLEVPDAARYCDAPFAPFYFIDPEHINHFDSASLERLAAVHGLGLRARGSADIDTGASTLYPVTWAMLTRSGPPPDWRPDHRLHERFEAYLRDCERRDADGALAGLAEAATPVLLWGAGSHAQRLLAGSALRDCRIAGVVDRDRVKQGARLAGHTITDPDTGLSALDPETVIVIAAVLPAQAIADDIRRRGLPNRVVCA